MPYIKADISLSKDLNMFDIFATIILSMSIQIFVSSYVNHSQQIYDYLHIT